jgi:DNA-binding protein YbaB
MFNKGNMCKMLKQAQAIQEDKEVLEDVIVITVNKTLRKAQDESQSRMNAVAGNMLGGLIIPGM